MQLNNLQEQVVERSRTDLLVKTYGLLTIGFILMAVGVGVGLQFLPQLLSLGKWGYLIVSLVATIGTMFLALLNQRNVLGYIFFGLFTFTVGFFDAPAIAVILNSPSLLEIFKEAFVLTAVITGSLTVYALVSKKDFSFMQGFLFVGLILVVVMAIIAIFWHNRILNLLIAGMGSFLFSAFILYDTSRLVHEKGTPVEIAIALFLDIVNLFWSLFELLRIFKGEE